MKRTSAHVGGFGVVLAMAVAGACGTQHLRADGFPESLVLERAEAGAFALAKGGVAAAVYVDAGDQEAVRIAAGHFVEDVGRVTGVKA